MPQFAVYRNENSGSSEEFPFLVDVQADVLEELDTRVVIPLGKAAKLTGFPMRYLIPVVAFQGEPYLLLTPQLGGISRCELGPQAGTLAHQERAISAAHSISSCGVSERSRQPGVYARSSRLSGS